MTKTADKTVVIDGIVYQPVERGGPKKIVIAQRGWVFVGDHSQEGEQVTLTDASVIRVWGTTKGLGEIALGGPTSKTVLDPCGRVTFHPLAIVATLDCSDKWA